jgi:hypothetical protein
MFHETFKLSHGAFVFAFLIAQAFNDVGDKVQPDSSVKGA